MIEALVSLFLLSIFVGGGYWWKRWLYPEQKLQSLSTFSMYFLGPCLVFWGFSTQDLTWEVLETAGIFAGLTIGLLLIGLLVSWILKLSVSDRAVFVLPQVLLNTGNMGMPLGLALFGPESLPYTGAINMVMVFLSYTVGVYLYSRGTFSVIESLKNMIKLPILWAAAVAIFLNIYGVAFSSSVLDFLEIAGHTAIGMQLVILGISLVGGLSIGSRRMYYNLGAKVLLLPILAFGVVYFGKLEGMLAQIILFQSLMPAAVNNINLASVYKCEEERVVRIVFWSHVLCLVSIPVGIWWFGLVGN